MRSLYYYLYYSSLGWHILGYIVACVVLGVMLGNVLATGRNRQLRWIVPFFIASVLGLIYDVSQTVGIIFRVHSYVLYTGALIIADVGTLLFTIGFIVLAHSVMSGENDGYPPSPPPSYPPGYWPPPPGQNNGGNY